VPSKIILLFPGQASQYVGMGKELYESSAAARHVLEETAEIDGLDHIPDLCFNGPADELTRTDNVQPAITAVSIMMLEAIREKIDIAPIACAGHSLGEYAAHYAAGNLDFQTAMKLVQCRGDWMNEAAQPPNPAGSMVAVMGLGLDKLEVIVNEIGTDEIIIANLNSPGQIILSGTTQAVERSIEMAKSAGAKRAVMLNVSGAWHSPLMKPAAEKMRGLLKEEITAGKINFQASPIVIANATAEVVSGVDEMRDTLTRQITSSVRWDESVKNLLQFASSDENNGDNAPPLFVEVGPGKVLKGILRNINRSLNVQNVEDSAGVASLIEAIG